VTLCLAISLVSAGQSAAPRTTAADSVPSARPAASVDVPLEHWTYPAIERLAALHYIDTAFLGLRPWTRAESARLVQEAEDGIDDDRDLPADIHELLRRLRQEFAPELSERKASSLHLRSVYSRTSAIAGPPLTDSYHFGQTVKNDYGRPYAEGFNQVIGLSGDAQLNRFAFHFRGELQHAPATPALGTAAVNAIVQADAIQQPIPRRADTTTVSILDATAAVSLGGLQITFGKQSLWWGPGRSGSMILSNNAAPIYMARIAQVHAIQLPWILEYLGPLRFESFFGHLDGHHFPASPFFYGQKISFKPTPNLEFGFSRTAVFAGEGVTPLTFGNFARSFFSLSSGTAPGFNLRNNPGARHGQFDFAYRLPGLRKWGVVLYADSLAHDDVSPVSAPRRAAINPGIYLARLPYLPKLELRAEAVNTDPPVSRSNGGKFLYWQSIYRDAYTNDGNLMGSWIGREGKGGELWLTYHVAAGLIVEGAYRRAKLAKDFIPGGGTQADYSIRSDFSLRHDLRATAVIQFERDRIPVLSSSPRKVVLTSIQLVWSPSRRH